MNTTEENQPGKRRTTIVLPEKVLELGQGLAADDRRSFSNYLEVLIERDARQNGKNAALEGAGMAHAA